MEMARGARLGPYEILAPIGRGGMGDVYRGLDTRLNRAIAIKVLAASVTSDSTKRQRFEREAQAIAALSHPHVCSVFDVGSHDGVEFLVMEYLEGETLDRRLLRGALPMEDVLRYAIQIAAALDHAHRHGIVHRDLKPTNIMLTSAGAKLLDFGLARWHDAGPVRWGADHEAALPETQSLTAEGTIVGTLQYMAPEQVEGMAADARADLFAFGAIVYEMATGQTAFTAGSHAGLMAAILTADPPPMTSRVPQISPALERLVRKCLVKDPEARWQTARDLLDELQWIADQKSPTAAVPQKRRAHLVWVAVGIAVATTTLAVALSSIPFRSTPADDPAVRFVLPPPEHATFNSSTGFMALSPDGRQLAFSATSASGAPALWIRSLDSLAVRQILGTEGGLQPFWSPDGRLFGFLAGSSLKRIDPSGGVAETIVDFPGAYTGTWNRDGVFLFMLGGGRRGTLYRPSETGGPPTPVTTLDLARGEYLHTWPQFLPDGRHFLFTAHSTQPEHHRVVYVGSLESPDRVRLVNAWSRAEYASPGYLLYISTAAPVSNQVAGGTLVAQPFDAASLRVTGEPVRIAGDVDLTRDLGRGAFSVSQTGVLTYSPVATTELGWYDRSGALLESIGTAAHPSLSRDSKRLAFRRSDPDTGTSSIWLSDVAGGNVSRLTFGAFSDDMPLWSPDGQRIVFRADRGQGPGLYQKAADGTGPEEVLVPPQAGPPDPHLFPLAWSGDGRTLIFGKSGSTTGADLWVLPIDGDRRAAPLFDEPSEESAAQISSDGRWLAYVTTESGQQEIYVRPFPSGDGRWMVSSEGGTEPAWSHDGTEMFYLSPDRSLMSVSVQTNSGRFEWRAPIRLFQTRLRAPTVGARNQYLVSADGQRFLINQPPEGRPTTPIVVVLNWTAALRKGAALAR